MSSTLGQREQGLALVLVLWTLTLVTVLVASFSVAMRVETQLASNLVEHSQAGALAEAGVRIGIARLLEPDPEKRWTVDGAPYLAQLDGYPLEIRLRSEQGKIDLNRAPESVIRSLAHSAAGDEADPEQIADAILDWRDTNRNRRLHGAEDPAYAGLGRSYGARDGPFVSLTELSQVIGISTAVAERLVPLTTVYSGRPQIDPGTASRAVLAALPGANLGQVDAFLAARDAASSGGPPSQPALIGLTESVLSAASPPRQPVSGIFTVAVQVEVGAARAEREVIVRTRVSRSRARRRATTRAAPPFTIVAWSETISEREAEEETASAPAH